ncbi:sigma-70 family RNA polymerase sigma factor [Rhodoferax sp. BLA1]|uniref:sigma-70 family RNA polymerase sigma factor n=1 Tax=Rhodoferax sp. BLA1 TaxID=2576062 RepID=UPI0015D1D402|nr:sigma-70 family RNA polymerase sigma factor [Rhodoferax sp. BLA1]
MHIHYYRELLNFCAQALKDRDAAADVVQETYARVIALSRAQIVTEPRALLYRVARNLLTDQHRRDTLRLHDSLDTLSELEHPHAPQMCQPEQALDARQQALAMLEAINKLPKRCREAFMLNRFDGLSHQEIADQMGISRNMVAQHVIRAVLACKACDAQMQGNHNGKL